MVSVAVFAMGAAGPNKYIEVEHKYRAQTLRVALQTDHREGTTYVLPCKDRGFDAVWGPKITYEHKELDELYKDRKMSAGGDDKRKKSSWKSFRTVMANFNGSATLSRKEVEDLAAWIYKPAIELREGKDSDYKKTSLLWSIAPTCRRKVIQREEKENDKNTEKRVTTHLLGYSLMYALCFAEYLVFTHKEAVKEVYFPLFGLLRNPRGSGLAINSNLVQIGAVRKGMSRYNSFEEAVKYMYSLFDIEAEDFLKEEEECGKVKLHEKSVVLADEDMGKIKKQFDAATGWNDKKEQLQLYIGKVWEKCIGNQESTFAALHAFSTCWGDDIGQDANKGWAWISS